MNTVFNQIERPDYKETVTSTDGNNDDIIKTIVREYPRAVSETKKIAHYFKGDSCLTTAKNIWDFLRQEITYTKDTEKHQVVRLPRYFLATKMGDCKSYSLFTAGILANLGMKVKFRFASYSSLSPVPTHVYVATDCNGIEVIIDGVYKFFDKQKLPTYIKDITMKVSSIAGTEEDFAYGSMGATKKSKSKSPAKKGKGKLKDILKKAAAGGKKLLTKDNPVFILGRSSYLALVALNVRGYATRLAASIAKNPTGAKNVWEKNLGGKFDALQKAVNSGKKKKAILPKKGQGSINGFAVEGIGIVGTSLLASAAPVVLVVINKILKPTGHGDDPEMKDAIDDANDNMDATVDADHIDETAKKISSSFGGESAAGTDIAKTVDPASDGNRPGAVNTYNRPGATRQPDPASGDDGDKSDSDSDSSNPKTGGGSPKVGSFGLWGFDVTSPMCWINFILKGSVISTATEMLFHKFF